ncbi:hypothetical protein UP10_08545 [Bradyrhizobium sp. LTSPM299]|uniref:hypothetical protein n=1 Tax=Bradyrhizobium sp. LTSPM299 TaxID=1619233 RepID=UPI0005CA46C7|nr:hypothetical protein [Bradyrhizobium sp. LTSPM299]KJC60965.1 hypothetical protein UP10_08545 [Bradyrhizobium sp. LTSPM299]
MVIQMDKRDDGDISSASHALKILHGARSLPPAEAVEALTPFLEARRNEPLGDKLADASTAAVTELVRSLKENHEASDDLWGQAIDATLSFVNEAS